MAKQFFTGWEAWEKLVFILACAIVVTLLLGSMKLAYTHWRLRKFVAAAEEEKREQALHRLADLRAKGQEGPAGDEVPFGIRAIESGIEVEGVWISRSNTPDPASGATSVASFALNSPSRRASSADFERYGGEESTSNIQIGTGRPAKLSLDRDSSAERTSDGGAGKASSSAGPLTTNSSRSRHPPSSFLRFSSNPYIAKESAVVSTLEGLEAIHRASSSYSRNLGDGSSSGESHQSSNSTTDPEPISAAAPALLTGSIGPKAEFESSPDFDLLNSHRKSQSAETGQLTPRSRTSGQRYSDDLARGAASTRSSIEQNENLVTRLGPVHVANEKTTLAHPLPSPKVATLPLTIPRSSMPDVIPFAQFCQSAPPSPRLDGYRPTSQDNQKSAGSKLNSEESSVPATAPDSPASSPSLRIPTSENIPALDLPPPPQRISFEKSQHNILRGHGTGFEILKPGSFNPPVRADQGDGLEKRKACPPISMHNASRRRFSGSDGGRKLQKKRPPSSQSTASSDEESLR